MRLITLAAALILAAASAGAAALYPAPRIDGEGVRGPAFALASAVEVVELVRATRQISVRDWPGQKIESDLRVSLLVLDTGPATDVSPTLDIHLAMFNEITEYGMTWALEPVVGAYRFDGVTRTAPGIYEVTAVVESGRKEDRCYFEQAVIRIDARQLSVDVRNAPGLPELDARRYTTPIAITARAIRCVESPW